MLLDTCQSPDEVRLLSVCLSTAYAFLTDETLSKYKSKINTLIDNSVLRPEDFKVILKILTLLNFYGHRDKNIELIRKCSVLIKRTISEMTASDVYLLYEVSQVFFITVSSEINCCYSSNGYYHNISSNWEISCPLL